MPELVALDLAPGPSSSTPSGPRGTSATRRSRSTPGCRRPRPRPAARRAPAVPGGDRPFGQHRPARRVADRGRRRPGRGHQRDHRRAEGCRAHPRRGRRLGPGHLGAPRRRPRTRPLGGLPAARPHRRAGGGDPGAGHRHAVHRARTASTPTGSSSWCREGATLVSLVATALAPHRCLRLPEGAPRRAALRRSRSPTTWSPPTA